MSTRINIDQLKKIIRAILITRDGEISCEECYRQLDEFVEIHLRGKDAAEAMPLLQHHLELCKDCREEFTALLTALLAS